MNTVLVKLVQKYNPEDIARELVEVQPVESKVFTDLYDAVKKSEDCK